MKIVVALSCLLLVLVGETGAQRKEVQSEQEAQSEKWAQIYERYKITGDLQEKIEIKTKSQLKDEELQEEKFASSDEDIPQGSFVAQHSRFTFTSDQSDDKGRENRRNVVEMTLAVKAKGVPPPLVKPLVELGFGPQVFCDGNCTCDKFSKYRTADGSCNNLVHTHWGQASTPFRRWVPPKYDDGVSSPRQKALGPGYLPSARYVSYKVHQLSTTSDLNDDFSHMLMQWGQFLDHDITSTPKQKGQYGGGSIGCCRSLPTHNHITQDELDARPPCFPITVNPSSDPHFKTIHCMNFVRSVQVPNADCDVAPVEQLNAITGYIDASNVYGSSQAEQEELRTFINGGMKVKVESGKHYLPVDSSFPPSCNTHSPPEYCFKAGDKRCNENPTLQSMHTLFLWEHNRIAKKLKELNCHWDDEKIFQEARKIVGALMQKITYDEYLPIVLGNSSMTTHALKIQDIGSGYSLDYDNTVDAGIRNAFAAAAFRFGHSMIKSNFSSLTPAYASSSSDQLRDIFGNTEKILSDATRDIESYFRGLLVDKVQQVDGKVSSDVSQHLFTDGTNAFDLVALNIQRGRDHGLDSYIKFRHYCGKPYVTTFGGLSDTHDLAARNLLIGAYAHPGDIDLFTGALTETHLTGSLVGPTLACLLGQQFSALKRGDRFWFEGNDNHTRFRPDQLDELRKASLSRVICDNTNILTIQENAFKLETRKPCRLIPSVDLRAWKDPASWGAWGEWQGCVNGIQTRTRKCEPCNCGCEGLNAESRLCGCFWSAWERWGPCKFGVRHRSRQCTQKISQSQRCFISVNEYSSLNLQVAGNK